MLRAFLAAGICTAALTLAAPASAEPSSHKIAGHKVEVGERDRHGNEVLRVDGRALLRDYVVSIDKVETIGGHKVLVGSSGNGGNACDSAPFVLSFPAGKKPRLDGPLKACKEVIYKITGNRIRFESLALEGDDGEAWLWTLERGFTRAGVVKHAADPTRSWDDIATLDDLHPGRLLDLGGVAKPLLKLLAKDRKNVLPLINGVGSGEMEGKLYVGSACRPHDCTEAEVLVIADPKAHQLYLAWFIDSDKIVRRSTAKTWSPAARAAFDKWHKR